MANRTFTVIDLVRSQSGSLLPPLPAATPLYLRHFRLRQAPFADAVNPDVYFRTAATERALMQLIQCAREGFALGLITGPAGSGKTLMARTLPLELDCVGSQVIYVLAHPGMGSAGLLRDVIRQIGLDLSPLNASVSEMLARIFAHCGTLAQSGRRLVITVDECQFLGPEEIGLVRTFANLEESGRKVMTVFLFGEDRALKFRVCPEYASLLSRTLVRVYLPPFEPEETAEYVRFCCVVSGGAASLFSEACLKELHTRSEGVAREVNRLCHKALTAAALDRSIEIGLHHLPDGV